MIRDVVIRTFPLSIHSIWYAEKLFEFVNIASRKNVVIVSPNGSWTLSLLLMYKQLLEWKHNDVTRSVFQYMPVCRSVTLAYKWGEWKTNSWGRSRSRTSKQQRCCNKKKNIWSFSCVIIYLRQKHTMFIYGTVIPSIVSCKYRQSHKKCHYSLSNVQPGHARCFSHVNETVALHRT
jgi:hypothetical protein